jgi:hypothetical protein
MLPFAFCPRMALCQANGQIVITRTPEETAHVSLDIRFTLGNNQKPYNSYIIPVYLAPRSVTDE